MKGIDHSVVYGLCKTSKGWLGMLASPRGLVRLTMPSPTRADALAALKAPSGTLEDPGRFAGLATRLQKFFEGKATEFPDKLDLSTVTPFQKAVWQAARRIPRGQTASYGRLASEIGRPRAARAVGQAMGQNPFPFVVPCHRVIAAGGRLGGYGGGEDIKRQLLRLEGVFVRASSRHRPAPHR
jgi:methylated-DNA-[protein]-cysteine S-methyltransferase